MSEYVPDREPDAWRWESDKHGAWTCIATRDNATFCTEPEEHVERGTSLWLISTEDLDGIVRREVAKALMGEAGRLQALLATPGAPSRAALFKLSVGMTQRAAAAIEDGGQP